MEDNNRIEGKILMRRGKVTDESSVLKGLGEMGLVNKWRGGLRQKMNNELPTVTGDKPEDIVKTKEGVKRAK